MKAIKYELKVITETLSVDSITALLYKVCERLDDEQTEGSLRHDDGDFVTWEIVKTQVQF